MQIFEVSERFNEYYNNEKLNEAEFYLMLEKAEKELKKKLSNHILDKINNLKHNIEKGV